MSGREENLRERALELWYTHEEWSRWKALSAAWAEDYRRRKVREGGKYSVRQFGWLDYT